MHDLIEFSDNYAKTSKSLWQYYRDKSNNDITNSESFKLKARVTGRALVDDSTKDAETAVPFKYLSSFWRTLEMSLINCEINLVLTWSESSVITNSIGVELFTIINIKLYVPLVTLSTQDNTKLLQQSKSRFKRTIN